MSIRKRKWKTKEGVEHQAFVVDYMDQHGERQWKTFKKKGDAENFRAKTKLELNEGTHVADADSVTVTEAGDLWLKSAEAENVERTTLEQYEQHLRLYIITILGRTKLSRLTAPMVRAFSDRLREEGRSSTMIKYVVRSLGCLLADAQEQSLIGRNVVHDLRVRRKGRGRKADGEDRRGKKLKVGVDIPTLDEIKRIIGAAKGRWRPLLLTAIFAGLRASELRGLRWQDIDLKKGELHVRQRADKFRKIAPPKSEAGERTVPLPLMVVNTLREWRLACPKGELDLAFPNGKGNVEFHNNVLHRGLWPTLIAAGVVIVDKAGNVTPKYTGLHALRHFYASWCINRKQMVAWS